MTLECKCGYKGNDFNEFVLSVPVSEQDTGTYYNFFTRHFIDVAECPKCKALNKPQ